MTALMHPKPAKTGPKPRKRIARKSPPPRRSARPRPMRKGPLAEMRREAASLCSRITLARHPVCEYCRLAPSTEAAHVLGKKAWPAVRYELINLVGLCHQDHETLRSARPYGPSAMRSLWLEVRGDEDAWRGLTMRAAAGEKAFTVEMLEGLRAEARRLGLKVA